MTRARRADGAYILARSDVPVAVMYRVRKHRHPDLVLADGHLWAEIRQRHSTEDGSIRGDLYVCFIRDT